MNLYGSQLFRHNDRKQWNYCMFLREKKIGKYHLDLIAIYCITLTVVISLTI